MMNKQKVFLCDGKCYYSNEDYTISYTHLVPCASGRSYELFKSFEYHPVILKFGDSEVSYSTSKNEFLVINGKKVEKEVFTIMFNNGKELCFIKEEK